MSALLDGITTLCVSAGLLLFIAGTAGLLRFPDALTRTHALTKADGLAVGLVVLGLLPQATSGLEAGKWLAIWLILLLSTVTSGQLIGGVLRATAREP